MCVDCLVIILVLGDRGLDLAGLLCSRDLGGIGLDELQETGSGPVHERFVAANELGRELSIHGCGICVNFRDL